MRLFLIQCTIAQQQTVPAAAPAMLVRFIHETIPHTLRTLATMESIPQVAARCDVHYTIRTVQRLAGARDCRPVGYFIVGSGNHAPSNP